MEQTLLDKVAEKLFLMLYPLSDHDGWLDLVKMIGKAPDRNLWYAHAEEILKIIESE